MKSYQQVLAELKRRSVFKVSAVYGALAFGLLQVAEPLADALRLPDWTVPLVVALLLLGFPVALVLAWAFELTPEGVRRTAPAGREELARIVAQPAVNRWPAGVLALVGIGLLEALAALEAKAANRIPFGATSFWWGALYDPVRDEPRFRALKRVWRLEGLERS